MGRSLRAAVWITTLKRKDNEEQARAGLQSECDNRRSEEARKHAKKGEIWGFGMKRRWKRERCEMVRGAKSVAMNSCIS